MNQFNGRAGCVIDAQGDPAGLGVDSHVPRDTYFKKGWEAKNLYSHGWILIYVLFVLSSIGIGILRGAAMNAMLYAFFNQYPASRSLGGVKIELEPHNGPLEIVVEQSRIMSWKCKIRVIQWCLHIPLLKTTFPPSPPLPQNSSSNVDASTLWRWGKAARARGKANRLVPRMRPRLIGSVSLGFLMRNCFFCNLTKIKAGITIIGELFKTRLIAVSETAIVAAFLLLPNEATSDSDLPSAASFTLSDSDRTG